MTNEPLVDPDVVAELDDGRGHRVEVRHRKPKKANQLAVLGFDSDEQIRLYIVVSRNDYRPELAAWVLNWLSTSRRSRGGLTLI